MKYDFDTVIPRRGTGSYKWDTPECPGVIPMWVADMDFRTAPAIIDALARRVHHGVFGYTKVPDEYYNAVIRWFGMRHGWTIERDWIIYTSGVVPAVSAIIKAVTHPGDKVITQTPAYNCFFSSIRNNGCRLVENPLRYDAGNYTIDFDDLEEKASDTDAKVLLLCNPHNPSGRVWTRKELERISDIALRNGLFVISDEIHCELTFNGHCYTPFSTIGKDAAYNSAVCVSPSKAFNIAGLQIADIVTPDPDIRAAIDRAINDNEVCDVNPFGVIATIAAYNESVDWLECLKEYIWKNYVYLNTELSNRTDKLRLTPLQGTYLAWIDITRTGMSSRQFVDSLLLSERLMINPGIMYGTDGEGFIRVNLACPRNLLADAVERLISFVMTH